MNEQSLIQLTRGLVMDGDGVWTDGAARSLSYPESGNQECAEVEDASFWFRHRNECIVTVVGQHPPGGPILDVGGGNGFVTRRLLDEGLDVCLLEPGPVGAHIAKMRRRIPDVICAELGSSGFPDGSIPAIGCFDVIEHIGDDAAFMDLVHRLLRPAGLLYATTPAHRWLWSASDERAGHHRRHNFASISHMLGDRFEIVYFTYLFAALVPAVFFFRTLPWAFRPSRDRRLLSREVEHGVSGGRVTRIIDRLLERERRVIMRGGSRRLGSSCLFAARARH